MGGLSLSDELNDGSTFIKAKQSSKPALNGWAPGWYIGKCNDCGCYFQGDKRGYQCADCAYADPPGAKYKAVTEAAKLADKQIETLRQAREDKFFDLLSRMRITTIDLSPIDCVELIDHTSTMEGRAWVRGSIYGSPIEVVLDVQDEGRTLKIFVKDRKQP